MASATVRLMEPMTINGDGDQPSWEAFDGGNYTQLNLLLRVLKAGTAGTLRIQHAAVNRDDAFVDLVGTAVSLAGTGDTFVQVTAFLRYVRWRVDSGTAGSPMALVELVAKSSG